MPFVPLAVSLLAGSVEVGAEIRNPSLQFRNASHVDGYKVGLRASRRAGCGWITGRLTWGTASRNADRIERHQHQGFTLVRDALTPVVPARAVSKTVDRHPEQGCCVRVCKPPVRRHGATLECGAGSGWIAGRIAG